MHKFLKLSWIVNIHQKAEARSCRLYRVTMQKVDQTLIPKRDKAIGAIESMVKMTLRLLYKSIQIRQIVLCYGIIVIQQPCAIYLTIPSNVKTL